MKFKLALVYDSGKRYIIPFEVAQKVLDISEQDLQKLEVEALKVVSKG